MRSLPQQGQLRSGYNLVITLVLRIVVKDCFDRLGEFFKSSCGHRVVCSNRHPVQSIGGFGEYRFFSFGHFYLPLFLFCIYYITKYQICQPGFLDVIRLNIPEGSGLTSRPLWRFLSPALVVCASTTDLLSYPFSYADGSSAPLFVPL